MRILLVINRFEYYGAGKMLVWLANSLCNNNYTVTLFTFTEVKSNLKVDQRINWIRRQSVHRYMPTNLLALRNVIKEVDPEVCISFGLDSNIYNSIACLGLKTKSIICERNDPFKGGYFKLWFLKYIFRFANGGVFQLQKSMEYYSMIKKNTAVIPNPITESYLPVELSFSEREKAIVNASRLDIFQKRQDILIKAFAIVHKTYPEYKLYLCGSGPDKLKLENIIKELNLCSSVVLTGVIQDIVGFIRTKQMFVLSSDFEGIPNALIEAMGVGLPSISTDTNPGGARFLIQDGENGFVVPVKSTKQIAEKILFLIENPSEADRLGKNATLIQNRFTEAKILEVWSAYLGDLS